MDIGTLGDIAFEVSSKKVLTLQAFKRSLKARYATHQVINKKPVLEYLGPDLYDIDFQITLNRQMLGTKPIDEINKIKKIVQSGEPQPLRIGDEDFGDFVVESMSEDWQHFNQREGIRSVASLSHAVVSLKLKEYN
ncbi:MAG: phage tail protein [Deltaproteobacteria bacterium]|nr:phage tail protein [Deltaproteobacteria bacterium]